MMVGVGATGPTGKRLSLAEIKSLTCIVCLCLAVCIHDKHTGQTKETAAKRLEVSFGRVLYQIPPEVSSIMIYG
jgi:hypothetical protein